MSITKKLRILASSSRVLGVWETSRAALAHLLTYKPDKDYSFDHKYGTDTASTVSVEDLHIADEEAKQAAVFYVSAPARLIRYMFTTLGINYNEFDVVDFGCGKGRVLMVASEFPFRSITGIEISRMLCNVAEENIRKFHSPRLKCSRFEVRCLDARNYHPTGEDTVFHFYHPFQAELLKHVLASISTRHRATGKRAVILYTWTAVESLFPLFRRQGFELLSYTQTANPRYQFATFAFVNHSDNPERAALIRETAMDNPKPDLG
ncbi:MAG: class I SAM-dependent methyltransferase [Verrucomicrobiota bacterium]|jgi:SAM-dependent methyltransferase